MAKKLKGPKAEFS